MRALHYTTGENLLVDLWSGNDYKILRDHPDVASLASLNFVQANKMESTFSDLLNGQAFVENDDEETSDEDEAILPEMHEIRVPPGPLGVLLNSNVADRAIVQGFTLLPNGEQGAIEKSGEVSPGMEIVSINDTNTSLMSLQQVTQLLGKLSRKEKVICFGKRTLSPMPDIPTNEVEHLPPPPKAPDLTAFQNIGECLNCGVPSSVHESKDCPYR